MAKMVNAALLLMVLISVAGTAVEGAVRVLDFADAVRTVRKFVGMPDKICRRYIDTGKQ